MKTLSWVVVAAVLAGSFPVRAEEPDEVTATPPPARGFLTGAGLTLLGLGVAGLALGISGLLISGDARSTLTTYGTPTQAEAPTALDLDARLRTGTTLAVAGFIGAGVLFAGGIALLVADSPHAAASRPVALGFMPTRDGVMISAQLRF